MRFIAIPVVLLGLSVASQAGLIVGLDEKGGNSLDLIDTTAGTATTLATLSVNATLNGLAAAKGGTYYFATETTKKLYSYDLGTSTLTAYSGTLTSTTASAAWYGGDYYYWAQNGDKLRKVTFAGTSFTDSLVYDFDQNFDFGDIAISNSGILYGSSSSKFFSVDLNNLAAGITNLGTAAKGLQLGFYEGELYGVAHPNSGNNISSSYLIDTATGSKTLESNIGNAYAFRDASNYEAVPEPATLAVLGLGAAAFVRRRRQK